MKSFLFSLTNGDKFKLTNKDQAVWHDGGWGSIFGCGYDLIIYDKSNINNLSFAKLNSTYKN